MSKFETVRAFYNTWADGDLDGTMAFCTDDVVWDNVPLKPFVGKERVRGFFEKFGKGMTNVHYDIHHHLEDGNLVMVEGVENYDKGGRSVAVPYMALFRFRDGLIAEMRDYIDLATVERQLALRD